MNLGVEYAASGLEVVALLACGMGVAFWVTDRDSPTSRAMAVFLVATGAATMANLLAAPHYDNALALPGWVHAIGFIEAAAFWAGTEWGLRVGRTVTAHDPVPLGVLRIRAAQLLAGVYALLCAWDPQRRADEFLSAMDDATIGVGFLLFAAPPALAALLVFSAGLGALRRKPDLAERVRIQAMLVAMPLFLFGVILPQRYSALSLAMGEIVFLLGALRYHVIQGARGQFMERFLAPQVAELVRDRGIKHAMGTRRVQLSVVCCDIRGFTAYARAHPPEQVIRLLRTFYASVGEAAAGAGGTIKDLAGDGALVLIGAPVSFDDHAARALAMGDALRRDTRELLRRHHGELGLGIGIATGDVAVGIAGDGARLEYVAVGPAVNLAARLCDRCADTELRVDAATLRDARVEAPGEAERLQVKGLDEPVETYVL